MLHIPDSYKEIVLVVIGGTIILLVLAGILIFVLLFYQKKKFQHARQLMHIEKAHSETLLQSKIEIQEDTFRNISQEIHDNIGQILTLVKLTLSTMTTPEKQSDNDKLNQSKSLLAKSIQDLRDISKSINTDYIRDIGLANAIRQQLQLLQKTGSYTTSFAVEGESDKNEGSYGFILFRIVQELLNNIVKHAKASAVDIRICYYPDKLCIIVKDNGQGFDPEMFQANNASRKGIGLSNMRNRMTLINGSLVINSTPGNGTDVTIELPVRKAIYAL
jgi:signal transduction histidine kinase